MLLRKASQGARNCSEQTHAAAVLPCKVSESKTCLGQMNAAACCCERSAREQIQRRAAAAERKQRRQREVRAYVFVAVAHCM
eukprot:361181-Chlamydomonas_euryale.AAC.5